MIGTMPSIENRCLHEFYDSLSSIDTSGKLLEYCGEKVSANRILYQHIPSIGAPDYHTLRRFWSKGIHQDAINYLESRTEKTDPAMQFVFAKAKPFWMSNLLDDEAFKNGRNLREVSTALKYVGDGLLVPLFGPYNKRGYAYVGFEKPKHFFDDVFPWQLQSLLQAVHVRYSMILEADRARIKLTNRESEVLDLLKFGKTNPEIGAMLGISTSTVTGHVKNIFLKLNTRDRVSTAMRAQSVNLC